MTFYDREMNTSSLSALWLLLNESSSCTRKIILEGGPGQGKSTITQMVAQIHREHLLAPLKKMESEGRWQQPEKARLVLRMELRHFAEWFRHQEQQANAEGIGSVEGYLATELSRDAGDAQVAVENIHSLAESTPLLLIFDGLDEVASDELRDRTLVRIADCVDRMEEARADLRVIVTTRPPAISGRSDRLPNFYRYTLSSLSTERIEDYLNRWIAVQAPEEEEGKRIRNAYHNRKDDTYVQALARNPMQLSVLLHFIRLKGEAFPSQRAELYHDYFQIVIDRDVEKNSYLRDHREIVEELHGVLAFRIHALTEAGQADRSLTRSQLLEIVRGWLRRLREAESMAEELFEVGNERLGLIVALRGEGKNTRYGFSIQPVQEYFAAAFINKHFDFDKAHTLFEEMARRPYWQEVALFLAGLRRPNEKADLLIRCKRLDDLTTEPWRGDGYNIALRMLQDGILSQRYLAADAIEFLLDLYDFKSTPAQGEGLETPSWDITNAIESLMSRGELSQHIERVKGIASTLWQRPDLHLLYSRFYRLIYLLVQSEGVEKTERFLESLQASTRAQFEMLPFLRLRMPLLLGLPVAGRNSFPVSPDSSALWSSGAGNLSVQDWASEWCHTPHNIESASQVVAPTPFHQALAHQLAFRSTFTAEYPTHNRNWTPKSPWAIWHLAKLNDSLSPPVFNQRAVTDWVAEWNQEREELQQSNCEAELDYSGLEVDTANATRDLIEICCACASCMKFPPEISSDPSRLEALELGAEEIDAGQYFDTTSVIRTFPDPSDKATRFAGLSEVISSLLPKLQELLDQPEHTGWMAAHVGATLLRSAFCNYYNNFALLNSKNADDFYEAFGVKSECATLWQMLRPYYDSTWDENNIARPTKGTDKTLRMMLLDARHYSVYAKQLPIRVRTVADGLLLLTDVFRQRALVLNTPFDKVTSVWMDQIPFNLERIEEFLELGDNGTPTQEQLLQYLGHFAPQDSVPVLQEETLDRILSCIRLNDDATIWRGAFIAISRSDYISKMTEEEILQLLRCSAERTIEAQILFHRHFSQIRRVSDENINQNLGFFISVARKVCDVRAEFSFEVVCLAAQFLANNVPVDLPPLIEKIEPEKVY